MDYWARTSMMSSTTRLGIAVIGQMWASLTHQFVSDSLHKHFQPRPEQTEVDTCHSWGIQDWQPALITNTACTESGLSCLFYSGHRLCTICSPIASSGEILHTLMEERRGICMKCFGIIHTDPQVEAWVPYRAFKMRTDSLKCKHTHLESIHTKASSHVHDF